MNQGKQNNKAPLNSNKLGVQLPPIDKKGAKQNVRQNAQVQKQEVKKEEDKYEQMRNRSRNNSDRLKQLKDIKNQYTIKKGQKGEKITRVKSETDHGINAINNNEGGQTHDFEMYEMEKMDYGNNAKDKYNGKENTENDIEALERELAQLKNDIQSQELSIAQLDEIQMRAALNQEKANEKPPVSQPDLKNMVFGQRVKGKDMNDYWNNNDQKTTYKVQQTPGGQSQVIIGGDYNYFKDKENSNYRSNKMVKEHSPRNKKNSNQEEQGYGQQHHKQNNENYNSNQSLQSSNKKPHPNQQSYNIINLSNVNPNEKGERDRNQYNKQQQQQLYSQQLREQIQQNNSGLPPKQNQQSVNIFDGYPNQNENKQNKNSSPFISNLYYQQEKEQNQSSSTRNLQPKIQNQNQQTYQQQAGSDISADGKKNVRVSQPPGGRSQIVFC